MRGRPSTTSDPEPPADLSRDPALRGNAAAIAELHGHEQRAAGVHQRAIESFAAAVGRPAVLYAIVALVVAWVVGNAVAVHVGRHAIDPPPYAGLQGVLGLCSVVLTTAVLIAQRRQGRVVERRAHLDLQVNLLSEQKAAKIIALLEELRRDLPSVSNRADPEAAAMATHADPREVLAVLEQTMTVPEVPRPGAPVAKGGMPSR